MADLKLPTMVANPDGTPTMEFIIYMDELVNGTSSTSIGTLLAGVNQAQAGVAGIVAGTTPLADVNISGVGSLNAVQAVQDANINAVTTAASSGALTATADKSAVVGTRVGAGTATTATVTITPSGGTAPYTYAWAKKSGDTIAPTAATSAATAFSGSVTVGELKKAAYTCTVTDNVAATYAVDVSVAISEIT